MKKSVCLFFIAIMALTASAQNSNESSYKNAIGLKLYPGAISFKHFITDKNALEGLAFFTPDGVRVTGLYEVHAHIQSVEGLRWYIGGGGHFGFGNDNLQNNSSSREGFSLGVDGVLGLDYKIKGAPLNLSFDWQPYFVVIGNTRFEGGSGGLGIRYTF
jgi:hypothetical protein